MQPEAGSQQRIRLPLALRAEAHIFRNASTRFVRAIAVRYFVAQHTAHSALAHRSRNYIKRAVHTLRAGVMIDERGRALAHCIDERAQCRIAHILRSECAIQAPPQTLKDFGEVFGGVARHSHAARKGTVEMGVRTNITGHQQLAARIQPVGIGILRAQLRTCANLNNAVTTKVKRAIVSYSVGSAPSHHGCICN